MAGLVALGTLIVFVIWFVSRRPKRKNQQASYAPRRRYEADRGQHESKPFIIKIVDQEWHSKEDKHHRTERTYWRLAFGASLATAVAAGFAAVFSFKALQASWDAVSEARNATTQAKRQADIAEEAFVESDRPIFSIGFADIDIFGKDNSARPTVQILANNIGSKPGFIEILRAQFSIGGLPLRQVVTDDCNWNIGVKTVAAAQNLGVTCHGTTLTFSQASMINRRTETEFLTGFIVYKSISGAEWRQDFCYYWFPGAEKNLARMEIYPDASLNQERRVDKKNHE